MVTPNLHSWTGDLEQFEVDAAAEQLATELHEEQAARLAELGAQQLRVQQWAAFVRRYSTVNALEAAAARTVASSQLHAEATAAKALLDRRPPVTGDRRQVAFAERSQVTETMYDLRKQIDRINWELAEAARTRWQRRRQRDRITQLEADRGQLEDERSAALQAERALTARIAAIDAHDNRVRAWEAAHSAALARGLAAHRELGIRADLTVAGVADQQKGGEADG